MARRGLLRALEVAARQTERDAARRYKANLRAAKQSEKMEALDLGRQEVELFETYVDFLVSIHKDCRTPLDWKAIAALPAPSSPTRASAHEDLAREALHNFRPGFFASVFGMVPKQRARLESEIWEGRSMDDTKFEEQQRKHAAEMQDWKDRCDIASRVLRGDLSAYNEVIEETNPFAEIAGLGSSVRVSTHDPAFIEATLRVNSDQVVPREAKSLLSSGKLSVKAMPLRRFNEIYQDYVCGAALRVARELFAVLPIDAVDVTAEVDGFNSATGRNELSTILSVQVTKSIADRINFELTDPSECMKNFVHAMKFTKSGGFEAIESASAHANARRRGSVR